MIKILVVDDELDIEPLFAQKFRKEIRENQMKLHFANSAAEAMDFMNTLNPFDLMLVLSDINMPGISGLELLKNIKTTHPNLNVLMVTAYDDHENSRQANQLGASGLVPKPVDFDFLKERITLLVNK
jgi:CheY-like chemotaxis protein